MTIAEPEVMAELRACASLSTVLRSIDDAPLDRVHVTFPVASTEQVSLPDMAISFHEANTDWVELLLLAARSLESPKSRASRASVARRVPALLSSWLERSIDEGGPALELLDVSPPPTAVRTQPNFSMGNIRYELMR